MLVARLARNSGKLPLLPRFFRQNPPFFPLLSVTGKTRSNALETDRKIDPKIQHNSGKKLSR
jgi:hypothetical protein